MSNSVSASTALVQASAEISEPGTHRPGSVHFKHFSVLLCKYLQSQVNSFVLLGTKKKNYTRNYDM